MSTDYYEDAYTAPEPPPSDKDRFEDDGAPPAPEPYQGYTDIDDLGYDYGDDDDFWDDGEEDDMVDDPEVDG